MTARDMIEVSSVVGDDTTGDGTREHPFATLERVCEVALLIEAVEGRRPVIAYDGVFGSMVPEPEQAKPTNGSFLAMVFGALILGPASLLAFAVLVVLHPWLLAWVGVTVAVLALGIFLSRDTTDEPELDDVHWSAW